MTEYRYQLHRAFPLMEEGARYMFIGVNPSTADDYADDATVRKWKGFVSRWNGSQFSVGNLFAARATDVRKLTQMLDPIGPSNDDYLRAMMECAHIIVPCWGSRFKIPERLRIRIDAVTDLIKASGKTTRCFGRTNRGDPKHPLMLGYDTTLEEWP